MLRLLCSKALLIALLVTLLIPSPAHAQTQDRDGANTYLVAVSLGEYAPINGDARWVYVDGDLVVSYRIQSPEYGAVVARCNGELIGKWRRYANSSHENLYYVASPCWAQLQVIAEGL